MAICEFCEQFNSSLLALKYTVLLFGGDVLQLFAKYYKGLVVEWKSIMFIAKTSRLTLSCCAVG